MIGRIISQYKILEKLGEGGMGVVYKAHDTKLDRDVALKFLAHYLTSDPDEKERFYHEARAAAALTHQSVAVVYEIGETADGQLFIAMEYVAGKTLRQIIGHDPLPIRRVLDYAIQICDGLAAAHERGIVHRDIKPENIILTPKDQVKITDFGLAKLRGATKLTKAGSTLGTAAYMSPEQARGEEVDRRSDIFSAGVVLYEMLAGRLPFRGEHTAALMYSIANEEPVPLERYNDQVTEELQHIVSKALEKNTEERYQHIDETLSDLRRERKRIEYARSGYVKAGDITQHHLPPVETAAQKAPGKKKTGIIVAVCSAVIIIAAFILLRPILFEEAVSSERRTVAVISFANQTGDPSFDYLQDAIPNLLITNLEQSKYLRVSTWERLYDLRKQAGKADGTFIDRETGFELCRMDGVDAIVLGSFTKAGDYFATDVKVLDVRTKQLLKSASSKGEGIGSILKNQIDDLSREISRGIGLSERKIDATPMQVAQSLTGSMEAFSYFMRGLEDFHKYYYEDALKFLQKAISIDSTFASAYINLAFTYSALNDTKSSNEAYQKAARYLQKTPERERLMAKCAIAANVEKNREKALNLMKEVTEKYPKYKWAHYYLGLLYSGNRTSEAIREFTTALQLDPSFGAALNQLGYLYARTGEYEKAIDCFQRYAVTDPGDPNPFDSMAELYFRMGNLDEAIARYRQVLDIDTLFSSTNAALAYAYLLKEENDSAMARIDLFIASTRSAGLKAEALFDRSLVSIAKGKYREAMADLVSARALFGEVQGQSWTALTDFSVGNIWYDRREFTKARKSYGRCYESEESRNPKSPNRAVIACALGFIAVAENDVRNARLRLAEIDSLSPLLDSIDRIFIHRLHEDLYIELLIAVDSADAALRLIGQSGVPDLPNFDSRNMMWYNYPYTRDAAARAWLRRGDPMKAISEYEKIVTFDPKGSDRRLILPKYHYALAKLYEQQGMRDKALQEFGKLLVLWKNADPDLPELKDAKSAFVKLKQLK